MKTLIKTLIKTILVITILTFLFIKIYVPLMYEKVEERKIASEARISTMSGITSKGRYELYQNHPNSFNHIKIKTF